MLLLYGAIAYAALEVTAEMKRTINEPTGRNDGKFIQALQSGWRENSFQLNRYGLNAQSDAHLSWCCDESSGGLMKTRDFLPTLRSHGSPDPFRARQ